MKKLERKGNAFCASTSMMNKIWNSRVLILSKENMFIRPKCYKKLNFHVATQVFESGGFNNCKRSMGN